DLAFFTLPTLECGIVVDLLGEAVQQFLNGEDRVQTPIVAGIEHILGTVQIRHRRRSTSGNSYSILTTGDSANSWIVGGRRRCEEIDEMLSSGYSPPRRGGEGCGTNKSRAATEEAAGGREARAR